MRKVEIVTNVYQFTELKNSVKNKIYSEFDFMQKDYFDNLNNLLNDRINREGFLNCKVDCIIIGVDVIAIGIKGKIENKSEIENLINSLHWGKKPKNLKNIIDNINYIELKSNLLYSDIIPVCLWLCVNRRTIDIIELEKYLNNKVNYFSNEVLLLIAKKYTKDNTNIKKLEEICELNNFEFFEDGTRYKK